MDNVKKQLRFFQVLVIILAVVVLAQGTFWLSSWAPKSSQNSPVQKVQPLQQSRVVAPVVSVVVQFISAFNAAE